MKKIIALCAAALFLFVSTSAQAEHRHHASTRAPSGVITCNQQGCSDWRMAERQYYTPQRAVHRATDEVVYRARQVYSAVERIVSHPAGCPRTAFCGCGSSVRVFGHPVRDLYLSDNWGRFAPASPGPGMVAWRHGHVFVIENDNGDGTVVAYDPNSGGHQTRIHTVSLRGFHVVDPNRRRYASR